MAVFHTEQPDVSQFVLAKRIKSPSCLAVTCWVARDAFVRWLGRNTSRTRQSTGKNGTENFCWIPTGSGDGACLCFTYKGNGCHAFICRISLNNGGLCVDLCSPTLIVITFRYWASYNGHNSLQCFTFNVVNVYNQSRACSECLLLETLDASRVQSHWFHFSHRLTKA